MRFKRITLVIALTLALTAIIGCRARTQTQTQTEVPLSSVAKEIQALGYQAMQSIAVPPEDWEISRFRMRSKILVAFRAEQPLPNETENYYVRFSLAEETYDSTDDARRRLDQIHDEYPEASSENQYTRVLREGFVIDRTTYVLQTDAAIFLPEIRRLTKTLATSRTAPHSVVR